MDEGVVHLHLEHRVAQRLLARFVAQGFVHHDLSRACLAQTTDSIPRVLLLGRLCLYGPNAARLHEEIVPITARWVAPQLRKGPLTPYAREAEVKTLDLLEAALLPVGEAGGRSGGPRAAPAERRGRRRGASPAPRETRAGGRRSAPRCSSQKRADKEAEDMKEILEAQRKRLIETSKKYCRLAAHLRVRRRRAAAARLEPAALGEAAQGDRPRAGHRARAHPLGVRGEGPADRAGGAGLPLAGLGVTRHGQRPRTRRPPRMARLPPAGRPRRLRRRPWRRRRRSRTRTSSRSTTASSIASRTGPSPAGTIPEPVLVDLPALLLRRPRLGARRPRRARPGRAGPRRARGRPARVRRGPPAHLRGPASSTATRPPSGAGRCSSSPSPSAGPRRGPRDRGPQVAGQPAGEVRAAPARDPGPDRPALQRDAPAAGLRPSGRDVGPPDLPGQGDDRGRGPADLRGAAACCSRRSGSSACARSSGCRPSWPRAASTRTSSRPSSPSRCSRRSTSCSGASRRPTTSSKGELLRDVLADDPDSGLRRPAHGPAAAGVPALRRGPRADLRTTRSTSGTTPSPACSSGSAATRAATPTRWTTATGRGRSCSCSSA